MARLSPPTWTTADGAAQVTKLPAVTIVTTTITPRANMSGIEVHYLLRSSRLRFRVTGAQPPITPGEVEASNPAPTAVTRDARTLVDQYPGMTSQTQVSRALELELSGNDRPITATVEVTVFDRRSNGAIDNEADDSVQISFAL